MTQTWTSRSANNQPDWITSVRRVTVPGAKVSDPISVAGPSLATEASASPHVAIEVSAPEAMEVTTFHQHAISPYIQSPTPPRSIIEVPSAGKAVEQPNTDLVPQSPLPSSVQSDGQWALPSEGDPPLPKAVHFPSLQ
jgi:hypothetical protein